MQRKWSYRGKKKKSLPLISRNLSIDVQRFKKKKKYPKYPGHVFGIRGKQIAKSPGRDRVPQPRPPGLIVSNLVYPAWRGAQWSLTEKVSSKGTFNSTCDKYRKNKRGRGRGCKGVAALTGSRTLKYAIGRLYTRVACHQTLSPASFDVQRCCTHTHTHEYRKGRKKNFVNERHSS